MDVEVRLFAGFRVGRFKRRTLDLPQPTRLRDLVARLDIPEEKVSLRLINGRFSALDQPLAAGDVVSLFPAVGGG